MPPCAQPTTDSEPAVGIIKRNSTPAGIAVGPANAADPIADAHAGRTRLRPLSAYGGVVAANREVTRAMAETVKGIFTEVIIAPSYSAEALEILQIRRTCVRSYQPRLRPGYPGIPPNLRWCLIQPGRLAWMPTATPPKTDNWSPAKPSTHKPSLTSALAWRALRSAVVQRHPIINHGAAVGIGMQPGQPRRLLPPP